MERAVACPAVMTGPLAAVMLEACRGMVPAGTEAAVVSTMLVATGDTGRVMMTRVAPGGFNHRRG